MNWQQKQLEASQRRIRELQAQQQYHANSQYTYTGAGQHAYGYPPSAQYPPLQQSYVYPPQTQWTVYDQGRQQYSSPYGFGQPCSPAQYYPQNNQSQTPPPPKTSQAHYPAPPWHTAATSMARPNLPPPTGRGLTYAELLSKAQSAQPVRTQTAPAPPANSHRPSTPVRSAQAAPTSKFSKLPQPPTPPQPKPQSGQSDAYPPSLLKYVERAFLQCRSDLEKSEIQKLLKQKIHTAKENGSLWTQNWESLPLPIIPTQNIAVVSPPSKRKLETKLTKKQQKKLKKQQEAIGQLNADVSDAVKKPLLNNHQRNLLTNDPAVRMRSARFGPSMDVDDAGTTTRRVGNSRLTFSTGKANLDAADADIELDWEALKICGTCSQLEKKYLRLTSAPDPSTVRPVSVLKKSFNHIISKWNEDRHYLYFWEQMKSLRQDLTIQHIMTDFTIEAYEANARVCLEVDDLSEYNQCQTQLSELYDHGGCGSGSNSDEFLSYRILYLLLTNDPMSISLLLHETTAADRAKPSTSHAISVLRAFRACDYVLFFNLANRSPLLSIQIIRHLFPLVRYQALLRIVAGHRPTLPVGAVSEMLGFGDNLHACRVWLEASGAVLNTANDTILSKDSVIIRAQIPDADVQDTGVTHGKF
uniref:PCI domain-containing protein n=1 Tax=Spongospora subterranea TaxID=70186 RepID=A0A0H5RGM9_9EUKA|eukprot:CRZ07829.1 hypothetical protein [Spongospora subterranea]